MGSNASSSNSSDEENEDITIADRVRKRRITPQKIEHTQDVEEDVEEIEDEEEDAEDISGLFKGRLNGKLQGNLGKLLISGLLLDVLRGEDDSDDENSDDEDFVTKDDDYTFDIPKLRSVLKFECKDDKQLYDDCMAEIDRITDLQTPTVTLSDIIQSPLNAKDKMRLVGVYLDCKGQLMSPAVSMELNETLMRQIGSTKKETQDEIRRIRRTHHCDDTITDKIIKLEASDEIKNKLLSLVESNIKGSEDITKDKLDFYVNLPYDKVAPYPFKITEIDKICNHVYEYMNRKLYGMDEVKKEIVLHVHSRLHNPNHSVIIGLNGPPGVGKTMCGKVLAEALNIPFAYLSMGSMDDPAAFKGHNKVYSGSGPSVIVTKLREMGVANGLLLIDEIDKLGKEGKSGQVQFALLHLLDPVQNKHYQDGYLDEVDHDLSKLFFMVTMNDANLLHPALLDRIKTITIKMPTPVEVNDILQKFALPKILASECINKEMLKLSDDGARAIQLLGHGNGMRKYEQMLTYVVQTLHFMNTTRDSTVIGVKLDDFDGFPYTIGKKCVNKLLRNHDKNQTHSLEMMYI